MRMAVSILQMLMFYEAGALSSNADPGSFNAEAA